MAAEVARVSQRLELAKEGTQLDLSGCELTSIPQAIFLVLRQNIRNITTVDLSKNHLSKISTNIQRFTAITELNLSNNAISQWDFLEIVPTVTHLILDNCGITGIPSQLAHLQHLQHLSHDSLVHEPYLKFSMNQNDISRVDETVFDMLTTLESLSIVENPIQPESAYYLKEKPFQVSL
eukprot:gene4116-51_t